MLFRSISALGKVFNDKTYHIGGVENGNLKWGANSETGELEAGDGTVILTENGVSIWNSNTEIARLGNLNGFLGYTSDTQGIAIGKSTQYMTYDPTNGLRVYGALTTDREILIANRTYYVTTGGSDSSDGLTAATAFLTIQHAIDTASNLDTRDYDITIQIGNGAYTVSPIICKDILGSGTVTIVGSTVDLLAVTLTNATGDVFTASHLTTNYIISGMRIISGGYGIYATHNSHIKIDNINFGACTTAQIAAIKKATVEITDDYTISDDSAYHFYTTEFGYIVYEGSGITVTVADSPDFTTFAYAEYLAALYMPNITWSGAATGQKFYAAMNSIIYVNDGTVGGIDYFPGDSAGATATGGQYA